MLRLLCAHVLQIHPRQLLLQLREQPPAEACERINRLARQLQEGEPLQYLLGETEFMGLPFRCSTAALIPRIDSEVLVEHAIELMRGLERPQIADVCCGSGTYGLSLAYYLPSARLCCCDISAQALELAQDNAHRLGVEERVQFACGDLLQPLQASGKRWQMIVSNPPYIASAELAQLDRWVQREPQLALDGGADGLDFYRRLAAETAELLVPGGLLLLEYGDEQKEAVAEIFRGSGLTLREQLQDLGRRERGAVFAK